MQTQTEQLFNNQWDVRISDPGLEGAISHYFETVSITLNAHIHSTGVRYEFTRYLENQVDIQRTFDEVDPLFEFLADYLGPVALGHIGIKIGKLTQA